MSVPQEPGPPPEPAGAGDVDELVERLRQLKIWAGDPSYEKIKSRVNDAWTAEGRPAAELTIRSTVANCFQPGRRRLNTELILAVVRALDPDSGYVSRWRQALRVVAGGTKAVSQARVLDQLPPDLAGFVGRDDQLDRLGDVLGPAARAGEAVVISAIEGMAGVGKTRLAVHAGHRLLRDNAFDRVLFVDLRGFHPDPAQPPADPAAVLDGFLRLLGVPGHQVPHGVTARATAYRERLAGVRALVVLDNAATAGQVGPLLASVPGCLTLITSRRSLTDLPSAGRLAVDVFTPGEAVAFLTGALPGVAVGADPGAAGRIARRCGHLPLALSLIAGHIRATPGWTLTDHADRLDERHHERRLDTGVELALTLSYRHLPADRQLLLRRAAAHPGQDFDAYAAAALTGADLPAATAALEHLGRDHLLQPTAPGRYTFHDLVRAYASARADDQDPPAARREALTRLFDHYLATAAAAINALHPSEAHLHPAIGPAGTPAPDLTGPGAAVAWLDAERHTLVAMAEHTATEGWPGHTTRLSGVLFRYLIGGGHHSEALTVYTNAHRAALGRADLAGQGTALTNLGISYLYAEQYELAADHLRRALDVWRRIGDSARNQGRVLFSLAAIDERAGRYAEAVDHLRQSLAHYREAGDETNVTTTLGSLATALDRLGHSAEALDVGLQALTQARKVGHEHGEGYALDVLANIEMRAGKYEPAGDHLRQCLRLRRRLRSRIGEGSALDSLGMLHTHRGEFDEATGYFDRALALFREIGSREGEAFSLNGLGEVAYRAGRPAEALTHHAGARTVAGEIENRYQQARAATGLGHAYHALGHDLLAREHYREALTLYTELGVPEAEQVRTHLAAVTDRDPARSG
ncbi:tetratricopeptide repeat protein [Actinoplanes sp. M2I2]|uniref:ATP-binding protein n=1 Tax=Actinoplanes sp. M2I2 TaxID=1734444 RepID=UPI0020203906|nr:tetratricopeptide repeat protein [Actinoplanes sp. M2I2]